MMSTQVVKKLCGSLLLAGVSCGAALAQQPYGTDTPSGADSATGASPGGMMPGGAGSSTTAPGMGRSGDTSGTGSAPGTDQAAPMPGGMESGASGTSSGGAAGMSSSSGSMTSGSGVIPEATPETPGATGPSDADPYKALAPRGGMKSR